MQEVFEKIIEKMEEKKLEHSVNGMQHEDSEVFLLECEEYGKFQGLKEAIEIVKQAAEEYNNGWIPCSEAMPEDCDMRFYMCIVENHEEDLPMFCQYEEECGFGYWHDIYDEHTLGFVDSEFRTNEELGYEKVIAWQPLPEPYQPNVCNANDCPINDGKECPAAEGCAGYEPKGE